MTYKIYKKENGVQTTEYQSENEFQADVRWHTLLEFAKAADWTLSPLKNGRTLFKRGDEKFQMWTSWVLREKLAPDDGALQ